MLMAKLVSDCLIKSNKASAKSAGHGAGNGIALFTTVDLAMARRVKEV